MKGTALLLQHSLKHCKTIVGEDFTDNVQLNQLLADNKQQVYLLYPSENAKDIAQLARQVGGSGDNDFALVNGKAITIILIDATWKKAFRIYKLSCNLHGINHLSLPENLIGQYSIRKTQKQHALSTLEACAYGLSILENNSEKYSALMDNFIAFNHFQLSFRPKK